MPEKSIFVIADVQEKRIMPMNVDAVTDKTTQTTYLPIITVVQ